MEKDDFQFATIDIYVNSETIWAKVYMTYVVSNVETGSKINANLFTKQDDHCPMHRAHDKPATDWHAVEQPHSRVLRYQYPNSHFRLLFCYATAYSRA